MKKMYQCILVNVLLSTIMILPISSGISLNNNINSIGSLDQQYSSNYFPSDEALLPVWVVGDSWTIHVNEFDMDATGPTYSGSLTNCEIHDLVSTITDTQNDIYTISFSSSSIDGYVNLPLWWGDLYQATLSGTQHIRKSDLSTLDIQLHFEGYIKKPIIPVKRWFEIDMDAQFYGEGYDKIDFPLYVGKSWFVDYSHLSIYSSFYLYNLYDFDFFDTTFIDEHFSECTGFTQLSVEAGNFEAFCIDSGIGIEYYYAPLALNFIRSFGSVIDGKQYLELYNFDSELKSLSLQNHVPYTPNEPPSGPSQGYVNDYYEFSISTIDPDGDLIKYGWDWNNDYIIDEWTSYYPSGDVVTTQHSWPDTGTYVIRVKARDPYGGESDWSPSATINIIALNTAPDIPSQPDGPSGVIAGVEYEYTTVSTDPDGDQIYYQWEWGDGNISDWLGPYDSGEICIVNHLWDELGTFEVKVKAKDIWDAESDWSDALLVEVRILGDINGDGKVNIDDLFLVLGAWGTCDGCLEDLNRDGKVNIDDIFIVLANWT